AFQIIDDILDVTQTSERLGKSAGKDIAAKKATYPAVIGLEKSRAEARRLTRKAHDALSIFDSSEAEALHALANYLLEREYRLHRQRATARRPYVSARFGSISSVSFDSNPACNRNDAANAIIAALSVHNQA